MRSLIVALLTLVPAAAFADGARTVIQQGRTFRPGEITINRGEAVTFTNNDDFIHQIYVNGEGFTFDTDERAPGQNVTENFTQPGTFEVRCHIHPKMKLVVHVN